MNTSNLRGILSEKYEIFAQPPHEGGFAYVYKGRHLRLKDQVALKVLKPKYAHQDKWHNLFLQEAVNLRKISHPNVVKVHDILEDNYEGINHNIIVMEWIDGSHLHQWRRENGSVDIGLLLNISEKISNAIQAIHSNQLTHHDITPFNILITPRNEPKLIDFGLSWAVDFDEPTPYPKYGVCLYLAPEQLNPQPLKNIEADIFSLGASLYYLFCGVHYLRPDAHDSWIASRSGSHYSKPVSTDEIKDAILNIEPDFEYLKTKVSSAYSQEIANLLKSMLHKNASDRPNIDQVIDRIRQIQSGKNTRLLRTEPQSDTGQLSPKPPPVRQNIPNFQMWVATQDTDNFDFALTDLQTLPDGKIRTPDLYISPSSNNAVRILITDEEGNIRYFDKSLYITKQPFFLTFTISEKNKRITLDLAVDGMNTLIPSPQINDQDHNPKILNTSSSEIVFLIDNALGHQFQEITSFIRRFVQRSKDASHVSFIGAIFYGEYRNRGISTPTTQLTEFSPPKKWGIKLEEILEEKAKNPPLFENKGFCSALEYALAQIANNSDKIWQLTNSIKHLVLLGMAPPHPMPDERETFGLLDLTSDEFGNLDWKSYIDTLRSQQIIRSAFWVAPSFDITSRGVEQYAKLVWSSFQSNGQFHQFSEDTTLDIFWDNVQKNNLSTFTLSHPLILPLLHPLYDPFS